MSADATDQDGSGDHGKFSGARSHCKVSKGMLWASGSSRQFVGGCCVMVICVSKSVLPFYIHMHKSGQRSPCLCCETVQAGNTEHVVGVD